MGKGKDMDMDMGMDMGTDKDKDKDMDKDKDKDMDRDKDTRIAMCIRVPMVARSMTRVRNVANMSRARCGLLMASLARPCM